MRAAGVAVELGAVAHEDLSDLAGGYLGEIGVEDADLGAHGRPARRVGRGAQVGRCGGGDHAGLGGVVVVVDDVAELVHELDDDVRAHP